MRGAFLPQVALGSDCTSALGPTLARTHSGGRIEFGTRCIIFQRFIHGVRSRRWEKAHSLTLDRTPLQSLPKVLLHEHVDGVLRPQTVVELAKEAGYVGLPTTDVRALAEWFHQGANQGSLAKYLEGFAHTIAVMQTEEALERVAYEQAEDLSKDGVVYFETRFAPIFHTKKGLTHQQVVSAVLKGLERGRKDFGIASS